MSESIACPLLSCTYEVLSMDSKCVTSNDSMRGKKLLHALKCTAQYACYGKHFNQRLHSNLQTMNGFVATKKHKLMLDHNTNYVCQKCGEDLPDPVTGLRGVPNRRACKGRGDHHTRGPHTWKGKRQDINSTDYCFTVQVSTTQVPTCIVDYSSLEQTDAQLEVELDKVEKMKKWSKICIFS